MFGFYKEFIERAHIKKAQIIYSFQVIIAKTSQMN